MGQLHQIVEWVKKEGEAHALSRVRLKVLGVTLKEGIALAQVQPSTSCSEECLKAIRAAASDVVGAPCPV